MNESNTTQQGPGLIAKLLGRPSPGPTQEIRAAMAELNQRRKAIESRLAAIQRETPINGGAGPERKRALTTGTPAEIVELDQEIASLRAELEQQLPAQESALRQRLDEAEKAECVDQLPGRLKALPKALAKHDQAQAALQAARAALDSEVSAITDARRKVGEDAPGVDPDTAQRIAEIRGCGEEPEKRDRYNATRAYLFENLGAGRTERRAPGYKPFGQRNRQSEKLDAAEQPDSILASAGVPANKTQQESGFWERPEPGQPRRPLEES